VDTAGCSTTPLVRTIIEPVAADRVKFPTVVVKEEAAAAVSVRPAVLVKDEAPVAVNVTAPPD